MSRKGRRAGRRKAQQNFRQLTATAKGRKLGPAEQRHRKRERTVRQPPGKQADPQASQPPGTQPREPVVPLAEQVRRLAETGTVDPDRIATQLGVPVEHVHIAIRALAARERNTQ